MTSPYSLYWQCAGNRFAKSGYQLEAIYLDCKCRRGCTIALPPQRADALEAPLARKEADDIAAFLLPLVNDRDEYCLGELAESA